MTTRPAVRRLPGALAGLLMVLSTLLASPPAQGAGATTLALAVADTTWRDGAWDHPYTATLTIDPSVTEWSLEVTVVRPDGTKVDGAGVVSPVPVTAHVFSFITSLNGGHDPVGTYTINGVVSTDDGSPDVLASDTFQVTEPPAPPPPPPPPPVHRARVELVASDTLLDGQDHVRFVARTGRDDTPVTAYARMKLQARQQVDGTWTWRTIARSTANSHGKGVFTLLVRRTTKFRVYVPASPGKWKADSSTIVTVRVIR
jgi:hypothetical protein